MDDAIRALDTARRLSYGEQLARRARKEPDERALLFEGEARSVGVLDERVTRLANALAARGVERGDFQVAMDPVQLYISIAALCFFYLSNSATLSVIFGRDLLAKQARDERLDHMVALVLAALTGKSAAALNRGVPRTQRSA